MKLNSQPIRRIILRKKVSDVISKIKSNPREILQICQDKAIGSPDIDPLSVKNGDVTNHVSQLTKILSKQYKPVFSTPRCDINSIDLAVLYTECDMESSLK